MDANHPPRIPTKDPISGKPLFISELATEDGETVIRRRFPIPDALQLEPDHMRFLETFLRCRGVIGLVEKELGISYPTVKSRLDQLLVAMSLQPVEKPERQDKMKILDQLERGEITPDQAKAAFRGEENHAQG